MRRQASLLFLCCLLSSCVTQVTYSGKNAQPVTEVDAVDAARTRIALGLSYLEKGETVQAKFNLDRALDLAPDFADSHASLAYYYQTVGDDRLAEEGYRKALSLDPDNSDALNNYGVFLCRQQRVDEAEAQWIRAIAVKDNFRVGDSLENAGLCLMTASPKKAIDYFERALRHQGRLPDSLNGLMQIHLAAGNLEQAQYWLDRTQRVGPLTAESMWLAYQINQQLGDAEAAKRFGKQLLEQYADSVQAQRYRESEQE